MNGAKTQEELIEQIAEDAFAAHIKDEKRNAFANEVLQEIRDRKEKVMSNSECGTAAIVVIQEEQIQALTNRLSYSNDLLSDTIHAIENTIVRLWGEDEVTPKESFLVREAKTGAITLLEDQIEQNRSRMYTIAALVDRISNVA